MLIQEIHQFIKEVEAHKRLSIDDELLAKLKVHFSAKNESLEISEEDNNILLECFASRWENIIDGPNDYTLYRREENQPWIALAKRLSKCYSTYLIPTSSNTLDYNSLSQLSQFKDPILFLVSFDNKTLITKRGLLTHLVKAGKLSTCVSMGKHDLRHLTVLELWRLKTCQDPHGTITVENDKYISLWDYLRKKIFTRLHAEGELSQELLVRLRSLVEYYETLKSDDDDFDFPSFKVKFNEFLNYLYQSKCENINKLYSVQLVPNEEYYLLDLFIEIQDEESSNLDTKIRNLNDWLAQQGKSSTQKRRTSKPDAFFEATATSLTRSPKRALTTYNPLYYCLTSLLTVQFSLLPFTGSNISIWDQSNTVFSEAVAFFNALYKLIEEDRVADAWDCYTTSLPEFLKNKNVSSSLLGFLSSSGVSIAQWYAHLEQGTLSKLSVCWYEPAIIFKTGMQFRIQKFHEEDLRLFLDELLHTYSQTRSVTLKKLRVNILFTRLMQQWSSEDKSHFISVLETTNQCTQEDFLLCAFWYVGKNLGMLENTTELFRSFVTLTLQDVKTPPEIKEIVDVINYFRNTVHQHRHEIPDASMGLFVNYLGSLNEIILSINDEAHLNVDQRGPTYTGAY